MGFAFKTGKIVCRFHVRNRVQLLELVWDKIVHCMLWVLLPKLLKLFQGFVSETGYNYWRVRVWGTNVGQKCLQVMNFLLKTI